MKKRMNFIKELYLRKLKFHCARSRPGLKGQQIWLRTLRKSDRQIKPRSGMPFHLILGNALSGPDRRHGKISARVSANIVFLYLFLVQPWMHLRITWHVWNMSAIILTQNYIILIGFFLFWHWVSFFLFSSFKIIKNVI